MKFGKLFGRLSGAADEPAATAPSSPQAAAPAPAKVWDLPERAPYYLMQVDLTVHGAEAKYLDEFLDIDRKEAETLKKLRIAEMLKKHPGRGENKDVFRDNYPKLINPSYLPTYYEFKKSAPKSLHEMSVVTGIRVVSDKVKDLIQKYEKYVHFYPLTLRDNSSGISYKYHFVQMYNRLDNLDYEMSGYVKGPDSVGVIGWRRPRGGIVKHHLRNENLSNRHFFSDYLVGYEIYSANLLDELRLLIPKMYEFEPVFVSTRKDNV